MRTPAAADDTDVHTVPCGCGSVSARTVHTPDTGRRTNENVTSNAPLWSRLNDQVGLEALALWVEQRRGRLERRDDVEPMKAMPSGWSLLTHQQALTTVPSRASGSGKVLTDQ